MNQNLELSSAANTPEPKPSQDTSLPDTGLLGLVLLPQLHGVPADKRRVIKLFLKPAAGIQ